MGHPPRVNPVSNFLMNLFFHELIHLLLSLFAGYLAWLISGNPYTFAFGLLGGFFVDIDHLIDYYLAFGLKFNLSYFLKGYQFLKSDKIYIFFHSWELVFILFTLSYFGGPSPFGRNLMSFALAYLFHIYFDSLINHLKPFSYFLLVRSINKFEIKSLVTTKHYKTHAMEKKTIAFWDNW